MYRDDEVIDFDLLNTTNQVPVGEQWLTITDYTVFLFQRKRTAYKEMAVFTMRHETGSTLEHGVFVRAVKTDGSFERPSLEFVRFCRKALRDEDLQRVSFESLPGCALRCEVRRRKGKSYIAKIYRHDAVLPQKRDKSLIITDLGGIRPCSGLRLRV